MIKRSIVGIVSLLIMASAHLCAQDPAGGAVALPEMTYKRLLNNLQIIVASEPALGESMTIGLVLRYGSAFDPAGKGGLANLVSRMFTKATMDRTGEQIAADLRLLGARLEIICDWDGVRFLLHGRSSSFERSLLLLYQVVCEAEFQEEDLAGIRSELLGALENSEDPRQRLRREFENVLFRSTTYGRSLSGSADSLKHISIGDVRLFYRRYFSSEAAALVVVGSTPGGQVIEKATRIWGVWVRRDEVPFTFLPPRQPSSRNLYFEDDPASPAAQFILGNLWPRRDDPEYYPCMLAARIMQERLNKELPTSLVTVAAEGRRLPGPFYIQGQAAADQAVGQIQKIMDLVDSLKTLEVTPEELAEARRQWNEEFHKELSSSDGICGALLTAELYRLGTNYLPTFPDILRRYDPETVTKAAKESLFPGGVIIVVLGPAATLKEGLEKLGPLQPFAP